MTWIVPTTRTFSPQDIAELMTTVVEGGSSYWCQKIRIKDQASVDYSNPETYTLPASTILVVTPDDDEPTSVPFEHIQRGLNLLIAQRPDFTMDYYDAEDADVFFQGWVFGEVVYG